MQGSSTWSFGSKVHLGGKAQGLTRSCARSPAGNALGRRNTKSPLQISGSIVCQAVAWEMPMQADEKADWKIQDNRRVLGLTYRVADMEATRNFFINCLGMKELRYRDDPVNKCTTAIFGAKPAHTNFYHEVTYHYGVDEYEMDDFGHFGMAVSDMEAALNRVRENGGKVIQEPLPLNGSTVHSCNAFIVDPTGYPWEFLERRSPSEILEPLSQVMCRVVDIKKSMQWYSDTVGIIPQRTRYFPEQTLTWMGYDDEENCAVVELEENKGRTSYARGNGYTAVIVGTDDVYKTTKQVRKAGGQIVMEPTVVCGTQKMMATVDPDGWKVLFVDNTDLRNDLTQS